jgi:hypothetical protein
MPAKDPRSEQLTMADPSTKNIERFLRMLTWQMFFLLALLFYLAARPQAGRYQFTVAGEDVVVFDTASSRAMAIKLEREVISSSQGKAPSGGTEAPAENKEPPAPPQQ